MNAEAFAARFDVSRETLERLERYVALLRRWNSKINVVAPSTLDAAWERHVTDSAQIVQHAPRGDWIDLGSGGGFPGLVASIVGERPVTLIEADTRKAAFLMQVVRETGAQATVRRARIEAVEATAPVISARALAPLPALLALVEPKLAPGGTALLMKGARWRDELTAAGQGWHMEVTAHPSLTDPEAAVLAVTDLQRRTA